jgi:hypothetical protein
LARDRGLSSYRRGLAALNEAWSLWDLGRPHALPRIRPLVPDAFRPRLDLMTALSSLDEHLILEQLGPLPPSICENEKPWLALVLLEWAFLTGGKARRRVRDSWLHDFIQSSASPELTRGLKACLDGRPLPEAAKTGVWRDDLDFAFLRALSWLDHDPGQALAIYRSAVEPILLERELETSLIPQLSTFASPPTAWTRRLGARLGIAAGAENALRVRVQRTEVAFTHGERTGSFAIARSPKTFQVLRALAGPAGRVITKQRLHEHLTGSRYVSHLHDDRLYKLLGRLAPRLESLTGTRVWAWSGQNDLVLLARIEVDND